MDSELLLTLLAFLLASAPVLWMLTKGYRLPGIILIVAGLLASQYWVLPRPPAASADHRPIEAKEQGYVTSKSCRSCHPGEYHSWHHSYHRTMTQVATPESVVGDFDDVELTMRGQQLRLHRSDDNFWATYRDLQGKEHRSRIVMTTGSHHMQFYWYELGKDREVGKLPFVYLFADQRWVPAESTFLRPPHFRGSLEKGEWNQSCMHCHSTGPQPRISLNREGTAIAESDTHVGEFGIACEACHGPGEQHIAKYASAFRRYGALLGMSEEHEIAHPDDIQSGRRSQICGQCHGISLPKDPQTLLSVFRSGFRYRPGDDLLASDADRILVEPDLTHPAIDESVRRDPGYLRSYFWPDGMVRVSGREFHGLQRSPCFAGGSEEHGMQCMSCHEMHPSAPETDWDAWADDQLKPGMRGNLACTQCHVEYEDVDVVTEHTHHLADSSGSQCYNCHMPHTTYGLLKGIRSHTVSTPSVQESVALGRPNACNLCHLDRTLDWTATQLTEWYGMAAPELTQDQQEIAASVLWATQGDAGLRVLLAWHFGWEQAQEASGRDWVAPFLGVLMGDAYDAVRYVAYDSLKRLVGFRDFAFDFVQPADLPGSISRVVELWSGQTREQREEGAPLLLTDEGQFDRNVLTRLLESRDETPVLLNE